VSRNYDSFSHRLGRWLDRFGFTDDPFALYEADRERPYLPYFFVDRPYLYEVLGNPARPQVAFLMAGRGEGKTATREMVAYECKYARLRRRALAVDYYDFSPLLEQVGGDLSQVSARHHVRIIVRHTLKALTEDVPATYFDALEEMDRALLMGYTEAFADPVSSLKLEKLLHCAPTQLDWNALSAVETLETLANLVTRLGPTMPEDTAESAASKAAKPPSAEQAPMRYQALYILVDRVDETACGPGTAVPLLEPLVSEGSLLKLPHVAFKFFLPTEVGTLLREAVALRPDRLCMQTITWDKEALRKMVQQRLSYYSEGKVERLEELCTSGAKASAMERLIQSCEGSPRTLLRLCRALIHHHVTHADEMSTLLTYPELIDTLREFEHRLEAERLPPSLATVPASESVTPTKPPERGLYADESGHVWVDGQPVTPSLSSLEFRLLKALYQRSPGIVPNEALIEAVWPSSAWMSDDEDAGVNEQNLRKLVARLRERLPGERSRFIKNVRGRGYWLKTN
jgi:DNA-binding response OmpR family regulator